MVTSEVKPPVKNLDLYNEMKMNITALYGLASVFGETDKMQHVEATIYKIAADMDDCLEGLFK